MPSDTPEYSMRHLVINPFKMHLSDAILATHLAKSAEGPEEVKSMHSRTAVAHAVFALECAANCFLALVPRNHQFRDKAEMWPILDKFDLYLLSLPHRPAIPRDHPTVTKLNHLIKVRDAHVHPKKMKMKVTESKLPGVSFKIDFQGVHSSGLSPAHFSWTHTDASKAISIVLDFLRLLMGLSGMSSNQLAFNLATLMECDDGCRETEFGNFNRLLNLSESIGVDVSFLLRKKEA